MNLSTYRFAASVLAISVVVIAYSEPAIAQASSATSNADAVAPTPSTGNAATAVAANQAPANAEGVATGDIVVTARRKEENAQTVPVSVSVVGAAQLATQGIETTNDIQRLVPGVILNGGGSNSNTTYTIRGQGKSVAGPGLPSVITYLNEVPLPSIGSFTPTYDVDNIQVLKGPQGTLFGRNTTGGAVLVYSAPATMKFGGYLQADLGNYSRRYIQGAINVPLINDMLAVRLAGDIERRDGYTRNLSTGKDLDDNNLSSFRASILFTPAEIIRNVTVFDYSRINSNSLGFYPFDVLNPALDPVVAALKAVGPRVVATSVDPFDKETFYGVSNTTTISLGSVKFKNIFGYRYEKANILEDGTGISDAPLPDLGLGNVPFYTPGQLGQLIATRNFSATDQISDEVQFSGSALNDKLSWLVGAFYLDARPAGKDYDILDLFKPTPFTPAQTTFINNNLGGIYPISSLTNTLYGDQSKALFGNLSYSLDELIPALTGVTLNGGFRYTWDKESVCSDGRTSIMAATGTSISPPYANLSACRADPAAFDGSAHFHAPTYTLGVDYKVSKDIFLYFTTRRGYRAGGLNTPTLAPVLSQFQTFKPQTVTDYEVGLHTKWRSGSWSGRFNIAAFTARFNDLQLQVSGLSAAAASAAGLAGIDSSNQPSSSELSINAGSARSKGVEFDGVISPLRALSFSFGASYLQQKFITLQAPSILEPFFTAAQGFTGAPKWSYQAAVDYSIPLSPLIGTLNLHADYYHIDKYFQGAALLSGHNLTNLNVQLENIAGSQISLTAYVDNLFNKKYIQNVILSTNAFGVYTGNYAPPRMYGVRLRYKF